MDGWTDMFGVEYNHLLGKIFNDFLLNWSDLKNHETSLFYLMSVILETS